ncbi:MAG: zinc-binding protein [Deltaproteobacteria bacterium]|nr:zinc-binding protein [Deltaproteobacteria bacterium]
MKRIPSCLTALFLILLVATVFSCGTKTGPEKNKKITVVTTLFPLFDFARSIAQGKADVMLMLPPGVEAHSYEPKPADIIKVDKADVFVYTGKYMEPWAHDILNSTTNKKLVVVDASRGIALVPIKPGPDPAKDGHIHGSYDPHIWLDFDNAIKMVETITGGLGAADPANGGFYRKNAEIYKEKLAALDKEYRDSLTVCKKKTLIHGGHFAFGYLARRYGLEYVSAYEASPNAEPTARKIVALQKKLRENNIHYIFYEELLNPRVAEIIAKETGVKLLKLNGAHNITKDEFAGGVTFFSLMEENLKNLREGLECR